MRIEWVFGMRRLYWQGLGTFLGFLVSHSDALGLLQHQGHISETAHALGISRKSLWEKMRKHAIAAEPLH